MSKLPIEILSFEELKALFRATGRGRTAPRNRALLALLAGCGLRLAEALALRPDDLDLVAGQATILRGKGDKRRVVGIWPSALPHLTTWAEVRPQGDLGPFICTLDGGPMSQAQVRGILARLRRRAGITKRVHAHGLRHFHADTMHRDGEIVGAIQHQLGHSSLATTACYLAHLSNRDAVEAAGRSRGWDR